MMRLRYVEMNADFRLSEYTHLQDLRKRERKLVDNLKRGDVVCFVSRSRTQVLFVEGLASVGDVQVVASRRWRLPAGGMWHPLMLGNYARAVGVELQGVKLFEEHYKGLLDAMDAEVREVTREKKAS